MLENKKSLAIEVWLDFYFVGIILDFADFSLSEVSNESQLDYKAGDIFFCEVGVSFYLSFFYRGDDTYNGLKVGVLEESSIEDFKSFILDKYNDGTSSLDFTFSIKDEPLDPKIIVTTIIWLLLLLPLLFLVYFIFK